MPLRFFFTFPLPRVRTWPWLTCFSFGVVDDDIVMSSGLRTPQEKETKEMKKQSTLVALLSAQEKNEFHSAEAPRDRAGTKFGDSCNVEQV